MNQRRLSRLSLANSFYNLNLLSTEPGTGVSRRYDYLIMGLMPSSDSEMRSAVSGDTVAVLVHSLVLEDPVPGVPPSATTNNYAIRKLGVHSLCSVLDARTQWVLQKVCEKLKTPAESQLVDGYYGILCENTSDNDWIELATR